TGDRILVGTPQHPGLHAAAAEAARDPERPDVGAQHQRATTPAHPADPADPAIAAAPVRRVPNPPAPTIAMTEVPALTRSPLPTMTDRSRRAGSTRSTCDPRRMTPIRWPSATLSPSPTNKALCRPRRQAICTTATSRPPAP